MMSEVTQLSEIETSDQVAIERNLAELRFCLLVLRKREVTDPDLAWLWRGRRRVAKFCLLWIENHFPPSAMNSPVQLSEDEMMHLIRRHELLQADNISSRGLHDDDAAEWMTEIRNKVRRFSDRYAGAFPAGFERT